MRCIHFVPPDDRCPGAQGETLLATEFFAVARRRIVPDGRAALPAGRCCAIMMLAGSAEVIHSGPGGGGVASAVPAAAGDTVLVPAGLVRPVVRSSPGCAYLEITLPEAP